MNDNTTYAEWRDNTFARISKEHDEMTREIDRLRKENETMRAAIAALAIAGNYFTTGQHGIEWLATGHDTPWEYAQSVKDKLEREE